MITRKTATVNDKIDLLVSADTVFFDEDVINEKAFLDCISDVNWEEQEAKSFLIEMGIVEFNEGDAYQTNKAKSIFHQGTLREIIKKLKVIIQ